jgi:hypothetical protein
MSKRVTLIVVVVAAVGILSAILITKHTGAPGSTDNLSGQTEVGVPEGATAPGRASATTDQDETGRTSGKRPDLADKASISQRRSKGALAIEKAAAAGKYTFVFFYSDDGEATQSRRAAFREVMGRIADRAVPLEVDTTDPGETRIVNRFGVSRAPMPLVLAVAPNGAITGGFPQEFEEAQLLGAFASPCEEKSLKALQERKVVLLCVQNGNTKLNGDAMKGVQDFKADPNFGPSTEIVTLDPADPSESEFLKMLQVAPQTASAVTVCLVPPGQAVARFTGETRKETIVAALSSGGGCGPGGCGPSGCGK